MTSVDTKVVSIDSLTPYVLKIVLDAGTPVAFKAGQYLQVVMGEKDKRPFSIANMPGDDGLIELHVGATPENPYAYEVVQKAKTESVLKVELGLGEAYLRESDMPLILIAGGTGYSYTKSILFACLQHQATRKVHLYWGAKSSADLYEADILSQLARVHENFSFTPVIENSESEWMGKNGLVHEVLLAEMSDFSAVEVYVAGRFEMAAVVRDALTPLGLPKAQLFGDAFAFI